MTASLYGEHLPLHERCTAWQSGAEWVTDIEQVPPADLLPPPFWSFSPGGTVLRSRIVAEGEVETMTRRRRSDPMDDPVWKTVKQAAARAQVSESTIYHEVRGRRELRLRDSYIDEWLESSSQPVAVPITSTRRRA
jgi:hypothetical protein